MTDETEPVVKLGPEYVIFWIGLSRERCYYTGRTDDSAASRSGAKHYDTLDQAVSAIGALRWQLPHLEWHIGELP